MPATSLLTGAHIFEECILGLLKSRGKTVVMPVHNLQFLQAMMQVDEPAADEAEWPAVHT